MKVPFYNFKKIHDESFCRELSNDFLEIMQNNAFIDGKYNLVFETEFARMQQAKNCLLVANGTDALEISLKVSGIGPGDKVGLPGITFYATGEAILNVGAIPVFIDVDSRTGLIDPDSLLRTAKNHQLKAVIPVHIFGHPAPISAIQQFCDDNQIAIIEDAAQAAGTIVDGKPVGASGNLTTFSFYPTKNLSAFGDAGCILFGDQKKSDLIKMERNHGRGDHMVFGRNSRCDHMQAVVLYKKLSTIEKRNQMRKEIAKKYFQSLEGAKVELMPRSFTETSSWHLFPINLESSQARAHLQQKLKDREVDSMPFYEKAMSQEGPLQSYDGEREKAEDMAGRTLCLPINPYLSDDELQFVAESVKEISNGS